MPVPIPNEMTELRRLWREERFDEALRLVEHLLKLHPGCAQLWLRRGDLIQLADQGPELEEAGVSYRQALRLAPNNLEALRLLAHFHDIVVPNRALAKGYAKRFVRKVKLQLADIAQVGGSVAEN